ncbi:ornithine cyclodeaminase [Saccharothrix tamanrassetensis]|uniref:Ornithine cyclodeaminase n=1 Tax=Saccharothrix tamanrassetensis TaxID=1051531 RepID=A0A841CUU4_9PSEU|nr:ornithine cyclodeaminase [Saccharothrix tamanrassetensis]
MVTAFSVVSADTVRAILDADLPGVVDLVERTYLRHDAGGTVNPPSYFLRFPDDPAARIIALPAALDGEPGVAGLKWISSFPDNLDRGLPRASAVLVLNDRRTGFPTACVEASVISATRTAASAALAARALAGSARRVGFVGAGLIAARIAEFLAAVGIPAERVLLHDHNPDRAARLAERVDRAEVARTAEEAVRESDLVVFATTAGTPHVTDADWLAHRPVVLHISLRDLSPQIVLGATNVVDDVEHCLQANTSPHLAEQLTGNRDHVHATLADVLTGRFTPPGDRPVVFSPFGLGVLDLALAEVVHGRALAEGTATVIPSFFSGLHPDR